MSHQTRLNDYERITIDNNGDLHYQTRTDTGRGSRFGSAQSVLVLGDQMEQIVAEYLRVNPTALDGEDDLRVVVDQ